jgi:ABC-type branched-subunit amino acid transport system ATPase component
MNLLEVNDVTSGYVKEIDILHRVSIHVDELEIVTIIGPNGSGKSTLLKTICGFLKPKNGRIVFDGESIVGSPPHIIFRKGLAYIAQWRSIFPQMTVLENLEMGGYTLKDKGVLKERIEETSNYFSVLEEKKNVNANLLSGGEQRMLELARTLIVEPKCLLIDEPTIALAPKFVETIFQKIVEINKEKSISVLIVEQNARKALSIAHRGYVLDMGEKKFEGASKKILADPKLEKLYLGG